MVHCWRGIRGRIWLTIAPRISLVWTLRWIRLATEGRLFQGVDLKMLAGVMRDHAIGTKYLMVEDIELKQYIVHRVDRNEHQQPNHLGTTDIFRSNTYEMVKRCLRDSPCGLTDWDTPAMRYNWIWWALVINETSGCVRRYTHVLYYLGLIDRKQMCDNLIDDFWRYLDYRIGYKDAIAYRPQSPQ